MATDYRMRLQEYSLSCCPKCNASHNYQLEICYRTKLIFFGGPGNPQRPAEAAPAWTVMLKCLVTDEVFQHAVVIKARKHEDIIKVRQHETAQTAQAPTLPVAEAVFGEEVVRSEAQEWVKASPGVARDFCKSMLTTSLGAIPVFFAVLKFLGVEKPTTSFPAWLGVLPAVLFLGSAALFMWVLRPHIAEAATIEEFEAFRAGRVQGMHREMQVAVGLFLSGVAVAIGVFAFMVMP